MSDHDHHGDYADAGHDHYDYDYADRYHRHYDDESTVAGLREDLGRAEARIRELEDGLRDVLNRLHVLEDRQPDYADDEEPPVSTGPRCAKAIHDSVAGWWCACHGDWPDEADDDLTGGSEYRYILPEDYERGQS